MIDQDQDGFIDADDLKEIFTSLGADPDDDFVNEMIAEAPGIFLGTINLKPCGIHVIQYDSYYTQCTRLMLDYEYVCLTGLSSPWILISA